MGFVKLVAPLEEGYRRGSGQPAVHPEVMVWRLLICSVYNIASLGMPCSATSDNIAYEPVRKVSRSAEVLIFGRHRGRNRKMPPRNMDRK